MSPDVLAHNLAWKLAAVVPGQAGPALLETYELERRPFARSLVNTTDRVFGVISAEGPWARRLRGKWLPALLGRVLGGTRRRALPGRFLFGLLSQLRLGYPHSPLSVGRAGAVRGGERLPYVPGSGNFGALREPGPQLHMYGVPPPGALAWTARRGDVALPAFPFDGEARRAGLAGDAAYLIRPDGYMGVAQPRFDGPSLDEVLRSRWHWPSPPA